GARGKLAEEAAGVRRKRVRSRVADRAARQFRPDMQAPCARSARLMDPTDNLRGQRSARQDTGDIGNATFEADKAVVELPDREAQRAGQDCAIERGGRADEIDAWDDATRPSRSGRGRSGP